MANKIYGEARLVLADERELTLRFDFAALCEAEEAADAGTDQMLKEMVQGKPRLRTARAMLYGSLRFHHPDVTLADVGEILMTDGPAASEAMGKAMEEMADRRSTANPPKGANATPPLGTGTPSSKHGRKAA